MSFHPSHILFYSRDADATAFCQRAGLTNPIHIEAIHYMVGQLKAKGLWSLCYAIYPLVGGNATAHAKNLISTSFEITFSGGMTHDSNGITFNGSTGYANTGFNPATNGIANNESMFLYNRTSTPSGGIEIEMGNAVLATSRSELYVASTIGNMVANINSTTSGAGAAVTANDANISGFYHGSRISATDLQLYKNGISRVTASTSNNGSRYSNPIFFGARNVSGSPATYSSKNLALVGLGQGFTTTQASNFYTIVQQFQTRLGRQV